MDSYVYLGLNLGAAVGGLLLMRRYSVSFSLRGFCRVLLLVSLPFIIWDAYAVSAGHWAFNERFILGFYLGNLAFEEILFFICIPFVMLVIYQIMGRRVESGTLHRNGGNLLFCFVLLLSIGLLLQAERGSYTFINSLVALLVLGLLYGTSEIWKLRYFWEFHSVLLVLFILFNTALTVLPVINYGEQAIVGSRIGSIPIEDFIYNFSLMTASILAYRKKENRK